MQNPIDRLGRAWLARWHGVDPDPNRPDFYRCLVCRSLVTINRIRAGGCPCRASSKISPAWLTRSEKLRLLWMPWTV